MQVVKYEDKFFSELYEVEKESFHDCFSEKTMKEELLNKNYYVLLEEGVLLGYAGYLSILPEAEIIKVAIKKKERGKGYGRLLLAYILEEGKKKGITTFFLEVRHSNEQAIKLYEKSGFYSYGIRKNYYEGIEDAILYRKDL